jgi:hypothetical protein
MAARNFTWMPQTRLLRFGRAAARRGRRQRGARRPANLSTGRAHRAGRARRTALMWQGSCACWARCLLTLEIQQGNVVAAGVVAEAGLGQKVLPNVVMAQREWRAQAQRKGARASGIEQLPALR